MQRSRSVGIVLLLHAVEGRLRALAVAQEVEPVPTLITYGLPLKRTLTAPSLRSIGMASRCRRSSSVPSPTSRRRTTCSCSGTGAVSVARRAPPHNAACETVHASQIIESVYVKGHLARAAEMARCIDIEGGVEIVPYILGIDLDVFRAVAAINPQDAASFHRLIRGALATMITIEAEWVDEE